MLVYILTLPVLFALVEPNCQFHVTVFRQLHREGFHLELLSSVEIVVGSENCPAWDTCTLALVESISSSFFVKPSELSRAPVSGCSLNVFNVEDPQNKSHPGVVYLYTPLQVSLNLVHSQVVFPLHLRYHAPQLGGGYALATLLRPKLLLQCEQLFEVRSSSLVQAPCPVCSESNCNWIELPYKTNAENFTVPVPVGDGEHLTLVTVVTYLLAFGGCLYLSLAVLNVVHLTNR